MKILNLAEQQIQSAVKSGEVTIAIYGAGKVGLPIAVVFAEIGANVIAVDIDKEVVDKINKGENPVKNEEGLDEKFSFVIKKGNMKATTELVQSAKESDVMIVIVPTILDEDGILSIEPLKRAIENIGMGLEKGDLIILESTLPPNFVEQNIQPILEKKSGLKAGKDFGLGFSPERVYSGRIIPDLVDRYPKIVSGMDEKTTEVMGILYSMVARKGVIKLSNIRTAEAMKVFEGIYRDVNIALANELALIAEKLDIDILELINAANTQPFSNILIPGAGVGGHCIPVYPYFIIKHEELAGLSLKLVKAARQINEYMPHHIIELLKDGLKEMDCTFRDAQITIMGLAFRGDVKEYRNSPSLIVADYLKKNSKSLKCYDPLFSEDEIFQVIGVPGVNSLKDAFRDANCLIFLTDHEIFKSMDLKEYVKLMKKPGLIVDGRQLFDPQKVVELGVRFKGVGRVIK
ncbi:MAG: nucleotide sugar dehydrogenase [Candidatus Helarchaeota archaeon]|nr:nucleotide sugar dehydrogenase [Candidatus Helarchaeota archaeon]